MCVSFCARENKFGVLEGVGASLLQRVNFKLGVLSLSLSLSRLLFYLCVLVCQVVCLSSRLSLNISKDHDYTLTTTTNVLSSCVKRCKQYKLTGFGINKLKYIKQKHIRPPMARTTLLGEGESDKRRGFEKALSTQTGLAVTNTPFLYIPSKLAMQPHDRKRKDTNSNLVGTVGYSIEIKLPLQTEEGKH